MRLILCASALLAVSSVAQDSGRIPQSPFQSKQAYKEFVEQSTGQWVARWNPATGTPRAIYGTGLPIDGWRENSLEEARRHARQVLVDYHDVLGLGTSTWQESIGARMGRSWSFKFDQHFNGLPVVGGRADVRVNMKGVIAMMGSMAWPIPANFNTTPVITEELAKATAWQQVGDPTGVPQPATTRVPQLVIWGDVFASEQADFFLAWEIPISNVDADGKGPIGRYYIDASTNGVLHYRTDKHECGFSACMNSHHGINRTRTVGPRPPLATPVPTTVTLMAWTRTGDDAYSALVNTPLPGIELNVSGLGIRTTDANGQFTIDINSTVTVSSSGLAGTHFVPISGSSTPSINQSVSPGVNATIQLGSSGSSETVAAHPTAAYWMDRTNKWCRSILGNSSQLNAMDNVDCDVNINSNCNAYYTGNTINFYTSGGGCANTAFSTVIAHEWGHGLDDQYGGISNSTAEGVSEGWGDILGLYLVDSPVLGSGFQTPGVGIRNGNNTRTYPYSSGSPHGAGEVWMGFAWKLREALRASYGTPAAIAISDDIVISSIVADATNRPDAVLEVFIADDDDGNLTNGTPHYPELESAALVKNLPYPAVQLAYVSHTPLANTSVAVTPRMVTCEAAEVSSGAITSVTLHYSANGGATQVRTMHPNGNANEYQALLPGLQSGNMSYHIEAVHNGSFTVRSPASGDYTYGVDGSFQIFWSDNFDGAPQGWTSVQVSTQNDWQVGDPAGKSGTSLGIPWNDPQFAASGNNCYGNDLGNTINGQAWNGAYQPNVYNYTLSPTINCSGRTGVVLRFKRWLTVEEAIYDQATLLVNGIQVWQNAQNSNHLDTSWQSVQYALPMADNNPAVVIEFRLQSDSGLHLGGWNIDDIEVGEVIPVSLDATLEILPEQSVQGGALTLTVQTQGQSPFLWVIGDNAGPTIVPDVPPILVGGNLTSLPAWTNGSGSYSLPFTAPSVSSTIGTLWYSQVLALNMASPPEIVTSNQFLNLFTLTP